MEGEELLSLLLRYDHDRCLNSQPIATQDGTQRTFTEDLGAGFDRDTSEESFTLPREFLDFIEKTREDCV
jgi:hypothetical protein